MQSFSQRKGLKPIKSIMQTDSMDDDLRNGLWNILTLFFWNRVSKGDALGTPFLSLNPEINKVCKRLWLHHFKIPLDTMKDHWNDTYQTLRQHFFACAWYEVYDFIEFMASDPYTNETLLNAFIDGCNGVLEREMSAYRFVDGTILQLTSEEEIAEIEEAINSPAALKPVTTHLRTAVDLLADKTSTNRDSVYRNSIKESISAVESLCNLITGGKDTLGDALKKVETKVAIHPALKKGFSSIYGYTNDASGIRHALLDEPNLDFEDAKYMLVSCSTFINYLISKAAKAGITY